MSKEYALYREGENEPVLVVKAEDLEDATQKANEAELYGAWDLEWSISSDEACLNYKITEYKSTHVEGIK